ncbi:beta-phosphoglucomutase family hydrolase [Nocardia goodfellowii]|uniref:Beta-phosphoglucomutase family hydrolase n=1 Tax=Nocardia goodfellowii TaxID=882446 RepID=A0ABS4QMV6_9NOCA|nr:beta-phosphoglucomutase family hydrolase [Nocardia goodfellowii]MBP2193042.1 beta-phosphoglucomutase family hydrolase [Nocardia goodfellowii]
MSDPEMRIPYSAVLFDMDGVVTDTAAIHQQAWKALFDSVLQDQRVDDGADTRPFDSDDYFRLVDGRGRLDAIAAFLESRQVSVPDGHEDDTDDVWSAHGFAARKNTLFRKILEEQGVHAFPGTVELLRRLRGGRVPVALVSASRNVSAVLDATDIRGLFDVIVDGNVVAELDLPGKPDPAMFVEAARRLGVEPAHAVVVEDAAAGVRAAAAGGFGLVVGIDRATPADSLARAGADIVTGDTARLDLGFEPADQWTLRYGGFDPAHEGHREALTALSNGYLGVRGAAPEHRADRTHYPGTYLAGVYNRLTSAVDGIRVEDEHLVNIPNWLSMDIRIADEPWLSEGGLNIREERRDLDLRQAVLVRTAVLSDSRGRRLRMTQRRIVSMDDPHRAAMETTLIAWGWSGRVQVRSGVDTRVTNAGVPEYRLLAHRHLADAHWEQADRETLLVRTRTRTSDIQIALAHRMWTTGARMVAAIRSAERRAEPQTHLDLEVEDSRPVVVDKSIAIVTSRDAAIDSPASAVLAALCRNPGGVAELLPAHRRAWAVLWDRLRIELDGCDSWTALAINLHIFHVAQTITRHSADLDAGIPPRGLHGEGYRGHVFWDEMFILPLLILNLSDVAEAMLHYRSRRLSAARAAATRAGWAGAMFPWQSGSDGREETPAQLFNPYSGSWMPDHSWRQRHVGLAVAYNAWHFYEYTGDREWLAENGAPLIIEVATLFAAMADHDREHDRYHIEGVMGPDEYHDGYPETPGAGICDNAYTNVLAAWLCGKAVETLDILAGHAAAELAERLDIDLERDPTRWERMSRRMAVCFHAGVISQFREYDDLLELDWDRYRERYGDIGRLDLILESEGDSTNRYKLSKQPDVLMLLHLFGPDQLCELLDRLGYPATTSMLERTMDYYVQRTSDGSTLSPVVHASILARLRPDDAWAAFHQALRADLTNQTGSSTRHGIHLGAMAGTLDIVLRSFAGMHYRHDRLTFAPRLPEQIERVRFGLHYHGHRIDVTVDHNLVHLAVRDCSAPPIVVEVGGVRESLCGGQVREFELGRTQS